MVTSNTIMRLLVGSKGAGLALGILVSNLLFTFGPLHFYHFKGASPMVMFGGIFAIGLLFGVLRWRSNNLWMVGAMHGVGSVYIEGLQLLAR